MLVLRTIDMKIKPTYNTLLNKDEKKTLLQLRYDAHTCSIVDQFSD